MGPRIYRVTMPSLPHNWLIDSQIDVLLVILPELP